MTTDVTSYLLCLALRLSSAALLCAPLVNCPSMRTHRSSPHLHVPPLPHRKLPCLLFLVHLQNGCMRPPVPTQSPVQRERYLLLDCFLSKVSFNIYIKIDATCFWRLIIDLYRYPFRIGLSEHKAGSSHCSARTSSLSWDRESCHCVLPGEPCSGRKTLQPLYLWSSWHRQDCLSKLCPPGTKGELKRKYGHMQIKKHIFY